MRNREGCKILPHYYCYKWLKIYACMHIPDDLPNAYTTYLQVTTQYLRYVYEEVTGR